MYKFGSCSREPLSRIRKLELNDDVLPFHVTCIPEALAKAVEECLRGRTIPQKADTRIPPRLLRLRTKRGDDDTTQRAQQEAAAVDHICPSSKSRTASRSNAATRVSRFCWRCACRRRLTVARHFPEQTRWRGVSGLPQAGQDGTGTAP
jgi:hypothetical protein